MKNGRINERNTGSHKLDGCAKRVKAVVEPVLTDEQYKAKEAVKLCNMILKEGVRLYENVPELVQHWIGKGIAEVKEIENPWSYARQFDPIIKVAYLVESHRSDIELVKSLMIGFYKI
jgi:hypothetical protein